MAARGIDIPALSHVFLYEPPEDHESYIHRAGRTGRAGAAGTVISLVDVMQRMELERIARHFKISLTELPAPTDDDVAAVAGARLLTELEARFRKLNGLERLRVARYAPLVRSLTAQDDGGDGELMLAMLLDACHQQSLRESRFPEGLPEQRASGEGKSGRSRRKRSSRREREERDGAEANRRDGVVDEAAPRTEADETPSDVAAEGARKSRRRSGRRRRGRGGNGQTADAPAETASAGQEE